MIWILDASVAVRWFLKDETHKNADAVLQRVIDQPELFAVPELFCYETYAVLCRLHPAPAEAFIKGMIPILHSGMLRQPMSEKLARDALRFVKKGLTGYDACYAALAVELHGTWLTFDKKAHQSISHEDISCCIEKALPSPW
jgi:predicted nucleic acid-binding protein